MRALAGLTLALLAALAGCSPPPLPANPALWKVTAPGGGTGFLFGTIHALPAPAAWRTPKVEAALAASGELMVEIADLNDKAAVHAEFQRLAKDDHQPPLAARLSPADARALAVLEARLGVAPAMLDRDKSWAAALVLANEGAPASNGIDQALLADNRLPLRELEGAAAQFGVFDALPEAAQRRMLAEVVEGAGSDAEARRNSAAWLRGDMGAIESETHHGLLADAALRDALYVRRNRAWAPKIASEINARRRPFVAVGAAHMAGAEGLVAMLQAQGFTVRRVE